MYLEAFSDLNPKNWATFDFAVTVILYIFAFWIQIYVHYLGEYLFLLAIRTPVYAFELSTLYIQFKYLSTAISTGDEIGVVSIGMLSCIIFFIILSIIEKVIILTNKYVPNSYSKFVLSFGISMILDPYIILIIDICYHHYECNKTSISCMSSYSSSSCICYNGDFIKLWYRMVNLEGNGITGLLITIILYLSSTIISCLLTYIYLIYIHRNSHILDIYRRIHYESDRFILPQDFEVSAAELRSICMNAVVWRGLDGSTRKVVLHTYESTSANNNSVNKELYRLDGHTLTKHDTHTTNNIHGSGPDVPPIEMSAEQVDQAFGSSTPINTNNTNTNNSNHNNTITNTILTTLPPIHPQTPSILNNAIQKGHNSNPSSSVDNEKEYIKHYEIIEINNLTTTTTTAATTNNNNNTTTTNTTNNKTHKIYRQFIILNSGAIIEIFDQYDKYNHLNKNNSNTIHGHEAVLSLLPVTSSPATSTPE